MNEAFLLSFRGEIQYDIAFASREAAERAARNPLRLALYEPSTCLKIFGKPGEYEEACKEPVELKVVRFVAQPE